MAFCANCGKEISPAAPACPQCGHPGPGARAATTPTTPVRRVEGFAIGSLIFSIVGLIVFPIVGSILGIVFASAAKRRIAEQPDLEGGQMARAATIVGWAGLALWVVIIGLIVGLVASSDRVILQQDSVLRW